MPAAQSDAARAINAYERLMERHMDMTERTFIGYAADVKALAAKFDAVDAKLTALDAKLAQMDQRLARIEKHLGIAPVPPAGTVRTRMPRRRRSWLTAICRSRSRRERACGTTGWGYASPPAL